MIFEVSQRMYMHYKYVNNQMTIWLQYTKVHILNYCCAVQNYYF